MAEENPHLEIKIPSKRIMNSRQQYLFENEKLILGRHGFIFRANPSTKEKLLKLREEKELFNKSCRLNRLNKNMNLDNSKNYFLNKSNIIFNKSQLIKSKSQNNLLSQPILRFKNRTDLERICDTIQPFLPPNEQDSIKEIRARHVKSIDFPRGIIYKGSVTNLKNFRDKLYKDKVDEKKDKIYFTRLQRLNIEAKKIRSNLHYKTHFKGVESVFINPKQIYNIKKRNIFNKKKNYAYNEKHEKEKLEKMNEYKNDINELIYEEKQKQDVVNSQEFSSYLNNKENYNDKAMDFLNKESEEEKNKKIRNINYLKKLAFKEVEKWIEKDSDNKDAKILPNPEFENKNETAKRNLHYEENQLRIGEKIYRMQNQMGEIAREILNKCKFYSQKKI